jgi:hypothetical protein
MSIHSDNNSQHLTISAPGHSGISTGPYTVAVLYKNIPFQASFIWYAYRPDDFSHINLYFDGDLWSDFVQWDGNLDTSDAFWRWIVVTKDGTTSEPTVSVADYAETGELVWQHDVFPSAKANAPAINRFSIGDEFGNGFQGDLACLTSFADQMDSPTIESTFKRSSLEILAADPLFFVHWPEISGVSGPFTDLARDSDGDLYGGVETFRSGIWTSSDDPPEFDFSLCRSGKPKIWNGSSWIPHPGKVWTGSSWVNNPIKGYDGSSFITSK